MGEVSGEFKRRMFQEMLQIEDALVFGDAIGEVRDILFTFKVKDPTPIR